MDILTTECIEHILQRLPSLTIGVLGDLFLDRYLDIDDCLTEKSIETGLDAYQVVRLRSVPGALGTVINNLVALGVGRVLPVSIIGDDGEGYEMRQALAKQPAVDGRWIISTPQRRTPTYIKPRLQEAGQAPRERNRLDIKNRTPTPEPLQGSVIEGLNAIWPQVDALIVLDQVSEADCGVVTQRVRQQLARLGKAEPKKFVLADSRERIQLFQAVSLKPNQAECEKALGEWGMSTVLRSPGLSPGRLGGFEAMVKAFAEKWNRPLFCTRGADGILLVDPQVVPLNCKHIAAYPVAGAIDPVGAGDSTSAGISCAVAAGVSLEEAAAFGCLVASITVQQIGTTGTASPEQVRQRWREVQGRR